MSAPPWGTGPDFLKRPVCVILHPTAWRQIFACSKKSAVFQLTTHRTRIDVLHRFLNLGSDPHPKTSYCCDARVHGQMSVLNNREDAPWFFRIIAGAPSSTTRPASRTITLPTQTTADGR